MMDALILLFSLLKSGLKNQTELAPENLALRQQLAILKRNGPRVRLKRKTGFSGLAFRTFGRIGENPSSWSSQKRSSGGIGEGLRYIGPFFQNTMPVAREQTKNSAISSAKWPMRIRPGEVRESTENC